MASTKISGTKITLRKLKRSDASSIYNNAKNKEISWHTSLPYPYKLSHAKEFINRCHQNYRNKSAYDFGIEKAGKIIGMISLIKVDFNNRNAEVGYWLGKKYWRKGITEEALKLIIDFGFNSLNLKRIYARVMHPNIASAKLLEKVGFKLEGKLRKHVFRNNKWMDELYFGLLK